MNAILPAAQATSSPLKQQEAPQVSSQSLRRFSLIDVPYTALLRSVNYVAETVLRRPLFSEDRLLTHKDRQVKEMLDALKEKKGCDTFADTAANFIQRAISHVSGSKMTLLPGVAGTWMRSWVRINGLFGYPVLGYGALYAKDRIDRGVKFDDALRASPTVLAMDRLFCSMRTSFAQSVIGRGVNYSVNLKHLVLNGLMGVDRLEKKLALEAKAGKLGTPGIPKRVSALIESLGSVLEYHADIDKQIEEKKLDPKGDDAFILRLEILKAKGRLPPGLPDPAQIKAGELTKKREEALLEYGKQLATWFLEKHAPDSLHRGFFGWLWWLEGEHQVIELAGPLVAEFALKQLIDPHRLYVAILTAVGAETMEQEHDKFGDNTRERIFKTGREMMEKAYKADASSYSILKVFTESKLESSPGGSKVSDQKLNAREQLKTIISGMIHDQLKSDTSTINSGSLHARFNALAIQASKLPGIGVAPILVRGLVNGAVFTIKHFRDGKDTPYIMGMIKELAGKKETDYLADKIRPCCIINHRGTELTERVEIGRRIS